MLRCDGSLQGDVLIHALFVHLSMYLQLKNFLLGNMDKKVWKGQVLVN